MREEEMFIAVAGMIAGVFIVRFFTQMVVRVVSHWRDVSLKMRLADAGMSADQIEAVVLAGRFEQPRRCLTAVDKTHRPKPVYAHNQ